MHVGKQFVVEIHSSQSDFCATDYVEDLPTGGVRVEAGEHGNWDALATRMLAGDPPDPEAF